MNLDKIDNAVTALKNGDIEGLGPIYLLFKDPLYVFLYRYTRDEQLSIDLVQDTFIKFQKYVKVFDGEKSSIKTYLFRMGYQLAINKLKRSQRMQTLFPFLFPHVKRFSDNVEGKLTVEWAIRQLPEKMQAVIILSYTMT
jgi:RNA polymerase sigma-70 factor, ECF subfamily